MNSFGHHSGIIAGSKGTMFIDSWGSGPYVIETNGVSYRFEDSDQFGPLLIKKNGDPRDKQPGPRSPFWRAHWLWKQQGRQMKPDHITCIWRNPRPTIYQRVGNRSYVLEHGEPDYGTGAIIEIRIGK